MTRSCSGCSAPSGATGWSRRQAPSVVRMARLTHDSATRAPAAKGPRAAAHNEWSWRCSVCASGVFMFFFGFERASWLLDSDAARRRSSRHGWSMRSGEPVVSRAAYSRRAGVCATGAAGSDAQRSRARARLLDENRRGDLARRRVEPSAWRRLDGAVCLSDGCERACRWWVVSWRW